MSSRRTILETSRFDVVSIDASSADGIQQTRYVVEHPGAVVILPLLPANRLCLIRNYRVAVGKTLIEAPAGTLEPGERPAETARRELAEETGYHAARLTELTGFFMSPGILNERMHLFVAEGLTGGTPLRDPGEEIENLEVGWDEAFEMFYRGEIEDAKTLVALLYYDRFHRDQDWSV